MNKLPLIILLVLIPTIAWSQFSVNYSVGYATYEMKDLKDQALDISRMSALPNKAKLTDNFPAYWTHNIEGLYKKGKEEYGIRLSYLTTGAKIAYADYSGAYEVKLTTNGYRLGLIARYYFVETKIEKLPISFFAEVSPAAIYSVYKVKENLKLYSNGTTVPVVSEEADDNEIIFYLEPRIGTRLSITNKMYFMLGCGYDFSFGKEFGASLGIDWTGLRLNGGIGYSF